MKRSALLLLFLVSAGAAAQGEPAANQVALRKSVQEKPRTGTIVGLVMQKGNSKTMNNAWVEVKADGEEKGRRYWPAGDRKTGGPDREILAAIRAVAIGARVQLEWVDAGDGKDITRFEVLKPGK